jgi:uncharacterized membrane protein YdbT with pleckstrin-like domain
MDYLEGLMGKNERIVLRRRQHWVTVIGSLVTNCILIVVFCVAGLLANIAAPGIALAVAGFVSLIPLGRMLLHWIKWWTEVYTVTNRRIIQIKGIINKHTIDSSLEKINDLVLNQTILGRLLGYGDLEIMTGSEIGVNTLRCIPDPVSFKTEMLNQKEGVAQMDALDNKVKGAMHSQPSSEGDIPDLIAELDDLRKKGIISDAEFQDKKAKLLARI